MADIQVEVVMDSKDGVELVVRIVPDSSGSVMMRSAVGSTTAKIVWNASVVFPSNVKTFSPGIVPRNWMRSLELCPMLTLPFRLMESLAREVAMSMSPSVEWTSTP